MGPIIRPTAGRLGSWRTLLGVLFCATVASTAAAADQIYFPAVDNVANILVQKINAETVRVDLSCWYLTEHAISIALINKYKSGVPVRLLGDRGDRSLGTGAQEQASEHGHGQADTASAVARR